MSAFSDFWDRITGRDILLSALKAREEELAECRTDLQEDLSVIEGFKKAVLDMKGQIPVVNPLEAYWNTKRPATNSYLYAARPAPLGTELIRMDPRGFFESQDSILPLQPGANRDDIALKSLQWVIRSIAYESDTAQFKGPETWLYPAEALFLRRGDCEDGSILLANMMVKAGIPYWRVRLNAGDVWDGSGTPFMGGKTGHCWVTYLRESDNAWYIYDWCYFPGTHKWKDAEDYFEIWFSWNRDFIFAQDILDRI